MGAVFQIKASICKLLTEVTDYICHPPEIC